MIVGKDIIKRQIESEKKEKISFKEGSFTELTPVKFTPRPADESSRLLLNGKWKAKKWPFECAEEKLIAENDFSDWPEFEQPGKIFYYDPEENPAEVPDWNRVTMDHIDPEDGAVIKREIHIPEEWKDKKVFLRFEAIYPAGKIYCNGALIGEHHSGLTPFEKDVTDIINPGKRNTVAVRLLRKHKFVQMDMPRHAVEFAGLAQDSYFFAVEKTYISDYHLIPELDASLASGTLSGTVKIMNDSLDNAACSMEVALVNPRQDEVEIAEQYVFDISPGKMKDAPVSLKINKPQLWNDEFPNLYSVEIKLHVDDMPEQIIKYNAGFRRFELKEQRSLLNGNPVKFRGVNHLTYHPEFGMHTPKEWLRRNLSLMKKANVNAIRTHFLGPRALAELCDEMGIYLLQELPIDWGTHYIHDPEWVGPALMRLEGGVRRDRHHPSVMVWSVGNENMPESAAVAEDGWNHLKIYDEFVKTLDPSRPTMFPPPGPANKIKGIFEVRVGDIADTHYSFKLIREFNKTGELTNPNSWEADTVSCTREEALANGWSGVWFSSEYGIADLKPDLLNAPYVSVITDMEEDLLSGKNTLQVFMDRLRDEWDYMRKDPTCLGGAYFPWMASGAGNNPWGWVRWGEDADWGVVTADLLPKPEFWALRVIFSPVRFPEKHVWKKGEKSIEFQMKNTYNSVDFKDCTLRTMMSKGGKYMTMMREWKDIPISCPPGEKVKVSIPLWHKGMLESLEEGTPAICRCIFIDNSGFRPLTADILVIPEEHKASDGVVPIGPDAIM